MARQGVTVGMLYVTGSNTAAVKLYESLGFTVDHVDRSYLLAPG
jgi:ribosomal protein S18 acetylase RimI-like enzyme